MKWFVSHIPPFQSPPIDQTFDSPVGISVGEVGCTDGTEVGLLVGGIDGSDVGYVVGEPTMNEERG